MARLRLGIVGLGFGARVYLPTFAQMPQVEVAAVADAEPGKARRLAGAYGIPTAYTDWQELMARGDIEAVAIVTPPGCHQEQVCAALAAGKHVLCEKPFGLNLEEARAMTAAQETSGREGAVDFEFRMDPGIVRLKELVAEGTVGRLGRVDITWLTGGRADPARPWSWQHDEGAGGGVLDNWGSHIIDYLEWICQSPITRVWAETQILIRQRKDPAGALREVTAEDSSDIVCRLGNGAVANLRFGNCYPAAPGHAIEIYGDKGRLVYQNAGFFPDQPSRVRRQTGTTALQEVALPGEGGIAGGAEVWGFPRLAAQFVTACRGVTTPELPDFWAGLRVRQVLAAIRKSVASGAAVEVPSKTENLRGS